MSITSLYIVPTDPDAAPPMPGIRTVLQHLGIIAESIGPHRYAVGDDFHRHVIFAGCSPYLKTRPAGDGDLAFCHVALHGPFATPLLVTGPNTVKPRCGHCRRRIDDWRDRVAAWREPAAVVTCAGCGAVQSPVRLDWRQHAIGGRVFIEVRNVFPAEATPGDALMQQLNEQTGVTWQYGWAGLLADDLPVVTDASDTG